MAISKYLDSNGLLYYNQKLNTKFDGKVDKVTGKGLSTNDFTTELKNKLDGIEAGATKVTVDSALSATSTNPVQNKIIKEALDDKVDVVSGKGLSTNDYTTAEKNKLEGIEAGANKTIVDAALSDASSNPVENKAVKAALDNKVDVVTGKGLSTNDFTTELKTKLEGIEAGATKVTVDAALSTSSVNPVQNKVIKGALDTKVDVEEGKGLSTNDYSNADKSKLAGIAAGAQVNVIESIKINGTSATISGKEASVTIEAGKIDVIKVNGEELEIEDKAVDIPVPVDNSELLNGAGYQNASEVQSAINSAISGITSFEYEIVQSLPATGVKGKIYLVPNSGTQPNTYDEYIWIVPQGGQGRFEKIGTTEIDLSGYWAKADLVAITNAEIDDILAD